ncbi:MAG: VOC family protein [Chloroflexi bacterium]|nr:VOC family protein [Chloroflexota bacterium]
MAINRFLHISICISDPAKSIPFYEDVLGFKTEKVLDWSGPGPSGVMDVGDSEFTTWLMTQNGYRLELIHYKRPASPPHAITPRVNLLGFSHMTLGVDDAEKTMRELEAKGVKVRRHTHGAFYPSEEKTMFLFEDPDGLIIEAFTARPDGALPYGNEKKRQAPRAKRRGQRTVTRATKASARRRITSRVVKTKGHRRVAKLSKRPNRRANRRRR